ncbi:DUF1800 domain-containing protein [Aquimarina agarivorans]|uniref:DUF1800 domain-containing protein n=1 Tax=Aquimarina agarivorans TaxID=980584 RepID=UPI000248EA96|nr:DUF1800 domain-containing protein [Aquimarina agarivorans]
MATCNISSLLPYVPNATKPWNRTRAQHLYRRLTYGASPTTITEALSQNPQELIDQLMDEAMAIAPTAAPSWAFKGKQEVEDEGLDFEETNQENLMEWRVRTVNDQSANGLQSLLTIFWHNHFVTQLSTYNCAHFVFEYYNMLQKHCLGNFKTFVNEIGLTSAMLMFLNGKDNKKNKPNENYARELYELFTLGENNGYTHADIVETSKALTGYNEGRYCEFVTYNPDTFNNAEKTIFGRTGNWNYNDVIDILFDEKPLEIAQFIVAKLYRFFVSPSESENIINELAIDFAKDFEIAPLLRKLFKSEHFFDDNAIGTLIKSPYDINLNFLKTISYELDDEKKLNLFWQSGAAGQSFYQPVDVAGWQGDYDWINTSTLTARWSFNDNLTWQLWDSETGDREKFRSFAKEASNNSKDVYTVVKNIVDTLLPRGLNTESDYAIATDIFMANVPENYFTDGTWNLDFESVPWQVVLLLQHIFRSPEFQLK